MEVLALARCFEFLQSGGKLAIVLPDSILSNANMCYVRDWMIEQGVIKAVVSLPIETFTPYGATHKTSLVIMRKWHKQEVRDLSYRTFLARVDNIGYDATGRRRDGSEVGEIVQQFRRFISEMGW
jgi:type I restriction enzyme M protein